MSTSTSLPTKRPATDADTPDDQTAKRPRAWQGASAAHLSDARFGIRVYRTAGDRGIGGILKERYVDFLVNEVGLDGAVCHLTTRTWQPPAKDIASTAGTTMTQDEAREQLVQLVGEATVAQLEAMGGTNSSATVGELAVTFSSGAQDDGQDARERRKAFHEALRVFCTTLISSTDHGQLVVRHRDDRRNTRQQRPSSQRGLDAERPVTHCVLYKENRDTMEAVQVLSSLLHIDKKLITYAGTKDRRAVTVQRLAIRGVPPSRLETLNSRLRGMQLGNFSCEKDGLTLGQLKGNRFVITLRNVTADDAEIVQTVDGIQQNGFVNYYGLQRFGTTSVSTHEIGAALLQSNWALAVDLILKPRGEDSAAEPARQAYAQGDLKKALNLIPPRSYVERTLLEALAHNSTDYLAVLGSLPRTLRMMYVHAFQSLIWNRMASLRLERHGPSPVPGDLVFAGSDGSWASDRADTEALDTQGEVDESTVEAGVPEHRALPKVIQLTETNMQMYNITDVVLPLPGFAVEYPGNNLREEYIRAMEEENVKHDFLRHRVREFSLTGSYRRIVGKPDDIQWSVLSYNDRTLPLVQTDLDALEGRSRPESVPDGQFKALQIAFTLPTSSYATMVLRELLKTDTSSAFQASLTLAQS